MATMASKTCVFASLGRRLLLQPATNVKIWAHYARRTCASTNIAEPYRSVDKIDVEALFISRKVQDLLRRLTGFDLEKVFAPIPVPLNTPRYKFLTDEQLHQELQDSQRRARRKLQMPPVLRERKPCEKVLAKDPEMQGFTDSPHVFIDISYGYKDRDALDKQWYRFVLDRACIQFEPDDPNYIRVTHATYDHIDANRGFHELRSTRHFGPMTFYLAVMGKVDNLLIDMLQREMIEDTGHLLRLFYHIHPPSDSAQVDESTDNIELVKFYMRNDSKKRTHLELALQTCLEIRSSREEVDKDLASARGH